MQRIPTRVHGVLDYVVSAALIATPFVFRREIPGAAAGVLVGVGAASILYSLATDYEAGVYRTIPMRAHLKLDVLVSLFLLTSPWLLQFADTVWLPHVLFGVLGIVIVSRSQAAPSFAGFDTGMPPGQRPRAG